MRRIIAGAAAAAVLSMPAGAAELPIGAGDPHKGAFVGGRMRLTLGENRWARLRAGITVAPTQVYGPSGVRSLTRFGEGVALDFSGPRPTLTVAGVRADIALRLHQQGRVASEHKLGISTGGWIAIGALAIAAVVAVTQFTCVGKDEEFCGSD